MGGANAVIPGTNNAGNNDEDEENKETAISMAADVNKPYSEITDTEKTNLISAACDEIAEKSSLLSSSQCNPSKSEVVEASSRRRDESNGRIVIKIVFDAALTEEEVSSVTDTIVNALENNDFDITVEGLDIVVDKDTVTVSQTDDKVPASASTITYPSTRIIAGITLVFSLCTLMW